MTLSYRLILIPLLILVVALGFYLRYSAYRDTVFASAVRNDARDYVVYAFNLKFLNVYSKTAVDPAEAEQPPPDARRSPGYPLYLAMFIDNPLTYGTLHKALLGQVLMSTAVVLLTFLIASPLLGQFGALLAALLAACSPHLINAGLYILSETQFSLLISSGLLLCYLGVKRKPQSLLLILAGLVLGFGALTRPALQYFPIVIASLLVWHFGFRVATRPALACVFAFVLILSPWVIRNIEIASDDSLLAASLNHGAYPDLRYKDDPQSFGYPYRYDPRSAEIERDLDSALAEIWRRFRTEPARHIRWYLIGKPISLWSWKMIQGHDPGFVYPPARTPYGQVGIHSASANAMQSIHALLVVFGFVGAMLAWLPRRMLYLTDGGLFLLRLLSLTAIYWTAVHIVAAPFPRYSVPLRPVLYILALVPLSVLVRRVTKLRTPTGMPKATSKQ